MSGISLNDLLIMKNWLIYAKQIGDDSYKNFDQNIKSSKYMDNEISNQIDFRKNEYNKIKPHN